MKKILLLILIITVSGAGALLLLWPQVHRQNLTEMPELKKTYPSIPSPAEGIVLLVYAHADDELATIAQVARLRRDNPKLRFSWYIVSDGSRGILYPGACEGLSKAQCRMSEARKVSECAGIPHPKGLGLPDGKIQDHNHLSEFLLKKIPELSSPELKLIFTHDNRGLYGHPDHLAVYDALRMIHRNRNVPLVSLALPQYFKKKLFLMEKARSREDFPITHALFLDEKDIEVKVCASRAHESQKLILNLLMFQGLEPGNFFTASPREFMHLE